MTLACPDASVLVTGGMNPPSASGPSTRSNVTGTPETGFPDTSVTWAVSVTGEPIGEVAKRGAKDIDEAPPPAGAMIVPATDRPMTESPALKVFVTVPFTSYA